MYKTLGRKILWQRARDYLRRYQPQVIGVTGSTGKTIAKDAITLAIKDDFKVRTAPQSYNTRLGVALTILGITHKAIAQHWLRFLTGSFLREYAGPNPEIIILELAANKPGDIDFLARSLPFTGGVITNVQLTNLDLFARQELLAHEFTSLIVDLPKDGLAILNLDDPLVKNMMEHSSAPTVTYGQSKSADVRLLRWHRLPTNGLACEILLDGAMYELHLPHLLASYHIPHVLAALAVVHGLGIKTKDALSRLQQLKTPPGRLRKLSGKNQSTLLDDSYNASPASAISALQLLDDLPARRRIAILGDMLRLGARTVKQHQIVGEEAASRADVLITVGENMKIAGAAALKSDHPVDVHHFIDNIDAGKWLAEFLKPEDLVLIKGSRDMHMEKTTAFLLANPARDTSQLFH